MLYIERGSNLLLGICHVPSSVDSITDYNEFYSETLVSGVDTVLW